MSRIAVRIVTASSIDLNYALELKLVLMVILNDSGDMLYILDNLNNPSYIEKSYKLDKFKCIIVLKIN